MPCDKMLGYVIIHNVRLTSGRNGDLYQPTSVIVSEITAENHLINLCEFYVSKKAHATLYDCK